MTIWSSSGFPSVQNAAAPCAAVELRLSVPVGGFFALSKYNRTDHPLRIWQF